MSQTKVGNAQRWVSSSHAAILDAIEDLNLVKRRNGPFRALAPGIVACLAMCAVTACDGDDSSATTTAADAAVSIETTTTAGTLAEPATTNAATAAACADRDAFRASVVALTDVDVIAEGTNSLTAAVEQVQDDLDKVRASAGSGVEPQIQAVEDAIASTQNGVDNLGDGGAAEVATSLSALSTAMSTLLTSLAGGAPCD